MTWSDRLRSEPIGADRTTSARTLRILMNESTANMLNREYPNRGR